MSVVPCSTCPWRRESTPGGVDIPGFDMDKMRALACTVGDGTDDFRKIMACHGSDDGNDRPCTGYLHRHGYSNLNVRIAAARGEIDMPAVQAACASLDLFESFYEMLTASEEALFDPEGYDPGTLGYVVRRSRWLLAQAERAGVPNKLAEQLDRLEVAAGRSHKALVDEIRSWRDL